MGSVRQRLGLRLRSALAGDAGMSTAEYTRDVRSYHQGVGGTTTK